jgi:hypothetical protein
MCSLHVSDFFSSGKSRILEYSQNWGMIVVIEDLYPALHQPIFKVINVLLVVEIQVAVGVIRVGGFGGYGAESLAT